MWSDVTGAAIDRRVAAPSYQWSCIRLTVMDVGVPGGGGGGGGGVRGGCDGQTDACSSRVQCGAAAAAS